MKSKILVVLIIVFVFSTAISIFIKNTFNNDNAITDFPNYRKLKADITTGHSALHTPANTPSPTPVKTYNPNCSFIDDFDEDILDERYWNKLDRKNNYNGELQAYVRENVFIENGYLVLMSTKVGSQYKSGLVNTKNKMEFQYGTIEIRLQYPTGKSFFPAIWMLPKDNTPYPEIDIMEVVGHNPDTLFFVYHYYDREKKKIYTTTKINNNEDFHIYKLVWTPDSLTWYVDNQQVLMVSNDIPHEPMYLIINFAVGGIWPGAPNENTIFPSKIYVDYVKIIPYRQTTKENIHAYY